MAKRRTRSWSQKHDHRDMIAMALSDGAHTLPEIEENFYAFLRRFGFFADYQHHDPAERDQLAAEIVRDLEDMIAQGRAELRDGHYSLTELGRLEARQRLGGLRRFRSLVSHILQPPTVTRVAVWVHLALAALKLPAGILSGSVALLNDAADTLLDGIGSLLVHVGIRLRKERAANGGLVLLMLTTGTLTLYEALRRLLGKLEPKGDSFAFVAILVSGLVCVGLGVYQRFVGLRTGSLALITQSIDSRNHVLTAVGVTAGLLASRLGVSLIDRMVGLAVAILILKSGLELGVELLHSSGEEPDLSRYEPGFVERFARMRQAQLRDWMLFLVDRGLVHTRTEMIARARQAFDFDRHAVLRELGLGGRQPADALIDQSLAELDARAWIQGKDTIAATEAGRDHLVQSMRRPRRAMRRTWPEAGSRDQ